MDPLYELIPKEILPKEYGGNGDDIKTMHSTYLHCLLSSYFKIS